MKPKIQEPQDNYSPLWAAFWSENPGRHRSVGADAVTEDGNPADTASPDGKPGDIGSAELVQLRQELKKREDELERFRAKHGEAERHRKEQERLATAAKEETARKAGDIKALEDSWAQKFTARETELTSQNTQLTGVIHELTVGATATSLAANIAMDGCAEGLVPHIRGRLLSELVEGKPVVRILDKNGKPSALTIKELEAELRATPYLTPLIKASGASGSGHRGGGGEGKGGVKSIPRSEFDKMGAGERAIHFRNGGTVHD